MVEDWVVRGFGRGLSGHSMVEVRDDGGLRYVSGHSMVEDWVVRVLRRGMSCHSMVIGWLRSEVGAYFG